MEYMSAREAANLWGISKRRVQKLCSEGRIEGAIKVGIVWAIPKGTKKPADARYKSITKKANIDGWFLQVF